MYLLVTIHTVSEVIKKRTLPKKKGLSLARIMTAFSAVTNSVHFLLTERNPGVTGSNPVLATQIFALSLYL